jgi:hypothetical protein
VGPSLHYTPFLTFHITLRSVDSTLQPHSLSKLTLFPHVSLTSSRIPCRNHAFPFFKLGNVTFKLDLLWINAWLPSTSHVPCGSVSHTLPHTLSLPHVFPFEIHALMGNLRFHSLNEMETSHLKVGNITFKEETPFASLYVGLLLPITPLSNGHLTLHFTSHANFAPTLKALAFNIITPLTPSFNIILHSIVMQHATEFSPSPLSLSLSFLSHCFTGLGF